MPDILRVTDVANPIAETAADVSFSVLVILGPYQGQYQGAPPFGGPEQPPYGAHNAAQYPPSQNQYPNNRQMYPPYGPEGEP